MRNSKLKSNQNLNNTQLIDAIKANDSKVLKSLYTNNYYKIEALVLKNNGTKDHAKDVYQDAFLVVWKNVKNNTFKPQGNTGINGYLYTIAKNKWMDYLRSKDYKKTIISSNIVNNDISEDNNDDIIKENRLQDIMQAFKDLGLPCKSLLTKFYFEKMSIKDIAHELQLDPASTRNKKYRCMQKLRELALKIDR